jgi:plastocyanin
MKRHLYSKRVLLVLATAVTLMISGGVTVAAIAQSGGTISGHITGNRRYMRHAIAYLERVPGNHRAPSGTVEMDQRNHQFVPYALPVVKGTTVRFLNNDNEAHNVFTPDGSGYDLGNFTGGAHADHRFNQLGVFTQLCHLHPSMIGYILVLQNQYFANVGSDGSFRIAGVPAGTYTLKVWQERGEGSTQVTVSASGEVTTEVAMGRRHRR